VRHQLVRGETTPTRLPHDRISQQQPAR
jgi:hypothetical protein